MSNRRRTRCGFSRRRFLQLIGGALGAATLGCTRQAATPQAGGGSLPLYIDDGLGVPVFRGPYLQRDAQIVAFLLPAERQQLKRLCDRCLNANGTGLKYVPLASYVLLLFADMKVSSLDVRDREFGWSHETELSFWIPTVAQVPAGGLLVSDHVAWFVPYLFVNNPHAIATGREVYGFPKMLGHFEQPLDMHHPEFSVDVWGFARFGPEMEGKLQRLLDMRGAGGEGLASPGAWRNWDEARSELIALLFSSAESQQDAGAMVAVDDVDLRLVFLKQFRDVADTRHACYQAVLEAPARVQSFYSGGLLDGKYALNFHVLESHPLPQVLGIPVSESGAVQALAAFQLHLDFTLGHGTTVG